jgi:hypothetical protein
MTPRTSAALVLFTSILARWIALDARPMHADEAILADITATLRLHHSWTYSAADYHGPVLPTLGAAVPFEISEITLRSVPVVAGIALAIAVGHIFGLPAGLLVALSPALVYWSRFYIPEMLLALFSALWLFSIQQARTTRQWAVAGSIAALMLATKETALLAFLAAAAAWVLARRPAPQSRHLALMSLIAAALAAAFLTIGFRQWNQLPLLPSALLTRAAGAGHEHPIWWYFSVLRWELLAIPLAALAWKRDRFLASYALVLAALYSLIPYKTPWCAVQFWWPVLVLAAAKPKPAYALSAVFAAVTLFTANPYAYAQTLPEALEVPKRIAALAGPTTPIQFFSTQNLWPLPWYLRTVNQQQWRRDVDFAARPAPLILVTPELEPKLTEWLYEKQPPGERELYMNVFRQPVFLRPGVEVRVYCAKRLWESR